MNKAILITVRQLMKPCASFPTCTAHRKVYFLVPKAMNETSGWRLM